MKTLRLKVISLFAGILFFNFLSHVADANEILQKIHDKLNTIDEIGYDLNLSINYFSEDYQRVLSTKTHLNFDQTVNPLGFKFQDGNNDYMSVYDGKKYFYVDKKKGTVRLTENPSVLAI